MAFVVLFMGMTGMVATQAVKVAGIGMSWDEAYARTYVTNLHEIGYFAKRYSVGSDKYLVVYSYREFSLSEATAVLEALAKK